MTNDEMLKATSGSDTDAEPGGLVDRVVSCDDYFTRCGDCGQFLRRSEWLEKAQYPKYSHAVCRSCRSNYDD
jgi:hypothetical protein